MQVKELYTREEQSRVDILKSAVEMSLKHACKRLHQLHDKKYAVYVTDNNQKNIVTIINDLEKRKVYKRLFSIDKLISEFTSKEDIQTIINKSIAPVLKDVNKEEKEKNKVIDNDKT